MVFMNVIIIYNLTNGRLWNGWLCSDEVSEPGRKINIYLEKGKNTNTHQIWTLPKDISENLIMKSFFVAIIPSYAHK